MPSTTRRALLGATATTLLGGITGCSAVQSTDPPAGSLRFENDDSVPHVIRLSVTGVGAEPGDDAGSVTGDVTVPPSQRTLTAAASVEPGTQRTYESVFTEPVWYAVRFTLDGRDPENDAGRTAFHPAPPEREAGRFLSGSVFESGNFSWGVSSTGNPGSFDI